MKAPIGGSQIYLDRDEARQQKEKRERYLNAVQNPRIRALGFLLLLVAVILHNNFILRDLSWPPVLGLGACFAAYCALSWWVLVRYYRPGAALPLDQLFFGVDLLFWTLAIYVSGGPQSWLFLILLLRLADQSLISGRRLLVYTALSMICYLGMLAYVACHDNYPVYWGAELTKMAFLLMSTAYLLVPAHTARRYRHQSTAAIHAARELIIELELRKTQLEEARARAEEANRLKAEFLRNISHELRTPMNGILGLTELTLDSALNNDQRRNLEMVSSSGQHLLALINNLLCFSALAAEQVNLETATFDPRHVIDTVRHGVASNAAHKCLGVRCSVAATVPRCLVGDPVRIGQLLYQLMDNAVKFTTQGEVELDASVISSDERQAVLRFTISDTGIGIAPEQSTVIFEAFRQGDGSPSRRHGGVGLGLSIAAELARLMRGTLDVTAREPHGTVFMFTAPFEHAVALGKAAKT